MTTTTAHANCDHEATKAARAACRKARSSATAIRDAQVADLLAAYDRGYQTRPNAWVLNSAAKFAKVHTDDPIIAANALLDFFAPSGDEVRDAARRANGYTITTDASTIASITIRSFA